MASPGSQGKQPLTPLAGPYGHPFHPVMVTIPIGAWVAALVFDLVSLSPDGGAAFVEGAFWLVGIGIVGALAAALFGVMDLLTIPRGTKAWSTGLTHMTLNLAVVVLQVVNFLVRRGQLDAESVGTVPLVLSVVSLVLLGASGYLGGRLAYTYGVRVADEATQAEGFRQPSS
jgi:uncharacterized membrane protein